MGLYYQPPLTFLGAQQPLTPRKRTPPSGSAPQNPPLLAVGARAAMIVSTWKVNGAIPLLAVSGVATTAAAPGNVLMGQVCM